ncbi:hypothetical protein SB659_19560, partial [Arthrobacter sp. SIMBA_036]|uniref:hypothetical protein n=1 Tax=Arthrobacter sp. SIMBA_036 TaxID=3085778 RepID=UPI003979A34D
KTRQFGLKAGISDLEKGGSGFQPRSGARLIRIRLMRRRGLQRDERSGCGCADERFKALTGDARIFGVM